MAGMPGGAGVGGAQGGSDGGGAGGAVIGGAAGTPTCRDETFESKTYLVCPNAGLDRAAARTFCQGRSADLVKIDSAAEDLWAYETVTEPGSIWIGANDIEQEGDWRWTDGSSVMAGYVAWATGQPNDSGGAEDCAVLHSGMGEWNDVACTVTAFGSDPMTVVCEP
jgi:hypothetical protein